MKSLFSICCFKTRQVATCQKIQKKKNRREVVVYIVGY